MSLNKNSLKSSTYSGTKSTFMKQNDQIDMLQTQYSSFSGTADHEDVNFSNDLFFEEDCLVKLKEQRKNIQDLSYLYKKSQDELKKQCEKVRKFQLQLQNYDQLKTIKTKYLALTKEFQEVLSQKAIVEDQNQKLKQKLSELIKQHNRLAKGSTFQKMRLKEQNHQQVNRYEYALKDREDEITRNLNVFQTKQKQYLEQIHKINEKLKDLKNQVNQMKRQSESEIQNLAAEILKRENQMDKLRKSTNNMKEENSMLRDELRTVEDQFLTKQQQWLQTQQQLISEVNNWKRKCSDSQHRCNESKYQLQRVQQKLSEYTNTVQALKQQLKSLQQQCKITLDQVTHSYEQKIFEYKNHVQELKESVEELLEVKNIFNKENQVLKDKIMKDDDLKKKRRIMMRSELRQIEKIQHTFKRIN